MPGFVKLTDAASGEPFYQAIDLITSFTAAATENVCSAPRYAQTAIYAGPYKNPSRAWPARWVREDTETVQELIRLELRQLYGDGPPGPDGP